MTRLIHMRGDLLGMFLFFVFFFVGLWQVVVAWKRLNGLSLTGCPDRKTLSYLIGIAIMAGTCAWYFSGKGHFAFPDLEGIETLLVMVGGLVVSSAAQCVAAQLAWTARRSLARRRAVIPNGPVAPPQDLEIDVGGVAVPCSRFPADPGEAKVPVLVLHDYGGCRRDACSIAAFLASLGHDALTVDLDGHGGNPRTIESASMEELLASARDHLCRQTGSYSVAVVGVGLGGLLAMRMVLDGDAVKAVALDPPARDSDGYHDISAPREYGIGGVLAETFKPSALSAPGKRISLSKLIASLPPVECEAGGAGNITIIGTRGRWLNYEQGLSEFAHLCSPYEPLFLKGTHESLPLQPDTLEILAVTLAT